MKTILILLVLAIAGIVGWNYYQKQHEPAPKRMAENIADKTGDLVDKTRDALVNAKDAVVDKAKDWKLTPADIKDELARTGRVVRSNASVIGEHIDDARIVTVIKGKYVMEKDLSALTINVDCKDGNVVLTGSVKGEENIARAVTLALQTNGVKNVVSQLVVRI